MNNQQLQEKINLLESQLQELLEWKRSKESDPFGNVEIGAFQKDIPVVTGDYTTTGTTVTGNIPVRINGINRKIAII